MSETPTFRFKGRATGQDREGYFYTRWDLATSVSVLAQTKSEARVKARAMLGTHPRFGSWREANSGWAIIWDSIEEEQTNE